MIIISNDSYNGREIVNIDIIKDDYIMGLSLRELGKKYDRNSSSIRSRLINNGFTDFRRTLTDRQRKIRGLQSKGRKLSEETKIKIGNSHRGEKSVNWKGGINTLKGVCEYCGKKIERPKCGRSEIKYCNNKCSSKVLRGIRNGMFNIRGNKHPGWKDKKQSEFVKFIRHSQDYKEWRQKVFIRDNFNCQKCGKHGCYLEAHHVKPLRKIIEQNKIKTYEDVTDCKELFDINKGITYCTKCHIEEDKMRARFITKEKINEVM